MELRLTKGGDSRSEVWVRFPAEPDTVWAAIEDLEQYSAGDGLVQIEEAKCPVANLTGYVRCANLDEGADIQKLNVLAARIDSLNQQEQQLFSAILSFECPPDLDKVLSLAEDLSRYELLDGVTTDWDLGKWAVENRKLDTNIPKTVWSYLDYGAIGREYAFGHRGEFCSTGYIKPREGIPELAEEKIILRLTLETSSEQFSLGLPISDEHLDQVKAYLGLEDFAQAQIVRLEPGPEMEPLGRLLPMECITVEDANELALCLLEMRQENGAVKKYCAALAAEQPDTFSEAVNIVMDCDDYEQIPEDEEEYGKQVLRRIGADDEIIDAIDGFMDFAGLGELAMNEEGVRRTEFGLVRRLSEPFPPEQESGQVMM